MHAHTSQAPAHDFHVWSTLRTRSIQTATQRSVFWDQTDATSAWHAFVWTMKHNQPILQPHDLERAWSQFINERAQHVRDAIRRGLQTGAFRHARHAWNALSKFQREHDNRGDFVSGWLAEVTRRIQEHQSKTSRRS